MQKLNLLLYKLKLVAENRGINNYKNMSKKKLVSALSESESVKSLDNANVKKIREDFNELKDRFLKPKIKEIRKNLYEIENKRTFLYQN